MKVAPHRIQCPTCARVLDMRSLSQVFAHEDICPSGTGLRPSGQRMPQGMPSGRPTPD
jgi:hypothetical protein